MNIGSNIKRLRKRYDMEQKDLAHLLHVSNRTISSWETNRTEPKMDMIDKMCEIFKCRKSDFLESTPVVHNYDYIVDVPDDDIQILVECYKKASYEDKKLIDSILYKYSDRYKKYIEMMVEKVQKEDSQ